MAPKYRLLYFNVQGRGEPVRFMLAHGNIPYEDVRYTHEEFMEKIKSTITFGQLPVLEVDGLRINQTNAICRYLARLQNLTGKTELEAAQADALVDTLWDATAAMRAAKMGNREELDKALPPFLAKIDNIVLQNGGYLVGNQLTWADIVYASLSDTLIKFYDGNFVQQYPNLHAMVEKVRSLPNIKKWIAERPADTNPFQPAPKNK